MAHIPSAFYKSLLPIAGQLMLEEASHLAKTAISEGGGGFLNGNTYTAAPLLDASGDTIPVEDVAVPDLINNITISPINMVDATHTQYLIDTMNRIAGTPADADAFRANMRARPDYADPAAASQGYRSHDDLQSQTLKKLLGEQVSTKDLEPDAKAIVKKAGRAPTDRHYCSREPHEFDWCMTFLKRFSPHTTISAVAEAGDHILHPTVPPTLGAFIDVKHFREAIELWRKLVNVTHGKNAKQLTNLMGITRAELLDTLIADPTTKQKFIDGCTDVPFLQLD